MADNSKGNQAATKQAKPAITKEKGKGTVKAVLSGDTIIVLSVDKAHQGLPVERNITLSNIQAPLLSRKKPERKNQEKMDDEDFAWASREFLRKKLIGKTVVYTIDHKTPSGKEYGLIQLVDANSGEAENITNSVVANGWAKVKKPQNVKEGNYRPELQELIDLEENAKRQNLGIWTDDQSEYETAKRPNLETVPATIYEQFKTKSLTGVVEQVRTGTSLRITLVPSFHEITLFLSGAQAPEQNQNGEFEPFGREAKFFTEHHILNRDVAVILEGIDRYNCYGSVSYKGHNLAEELLSAGLAKYVDWSASKTAFAEKLRAAEKGAKEKRQRIWALEQKPVAAAPGKAEDKNKPAVKLGKEVFGKVVEVLNGGTVVVSAGNTEYKINLSSVKVSKLVSPMLRKDDKNQDKSDKKNKEAVERAYAIEAKEYLRRRLVGQKVRCVLDYTRPPPQQQPNAKGANNNNAQQKPLSEADRSFYSVYLEKNNVAVELVEAGLAQPQEHRGGELRSKDYELMLMAEDRAKKMKKGIFAPEDKAPVFYVNDITQLKPEQARQYLPFLKRAGRQRAVVEYEFAAARYKVFVPKESAYIMFSIAAVRAPSKTEQYFKESIAFAREAVHQRDVEIEVLNQDKVGTFLGNLWVNKKNFASILLEEGLAETIGSIKENDNSTEYIIAEESAKRAHKNIWKDYDEQAEKERAKKEREERDETRKPKQEFVDVVVTEIIDGSRFYVQQVGPESEQLEELMKNLSVETSDEVHTPVVGELVKAQFTADDAWYRAKVLSKTDNGEYEVSYVDYGNSEVIPAARIRQLDPAFKELPAQAQEAQLAFIRTPSLDEDYGQEAAVFLRDMVMGKTMLANIEYRDNNRLFISLGDRDSLVMVNAALLRAGLARVENVRGKHLQQVIELLREEENKARQAHSYIWEYGDPGFDDVEEDKPKGKPAAKAPAKKDAKSTDAKSQKN